MTAEEQYVIVTRTVEVLQEKIAQYLDQNIPDEIGWNDVREAEKVEGKLREIIAQLP